jgi:hypothetical protein
MTIEIPAFKKRPSMRLFGIRFTIANTRRKMAMHKTTEEAMFAFVATSDELEESMHIILLWMNARI